MHQPENDFGVRDVDGPAREGAQMPAASEAAQEDLDKIVGTAKARSVHPGYDSEQAAADFQRLISGWRRSTTLRSS